MNLAAALLILLAGDIAHEYHPGEKVIVIRLTLLKSPGESPMYINPGGPGTITRVSSEGLSVEGIPGFIDPDDVVPFDEAIAYFDSVIDDTTTDPQLYEVRGGVHYECHRWEEAAKDYRRCVELSSSPTPFRHRLYGHALAKLHRYDDAIAQFNQALNLFPKDASAILDRASCKCDMGKFEDALDDCNKARSIGTVNYHSYSIAAAIFAKMGKFDRAIESQQHAMDLVPAGKETDKARRRMELYKAKESVPLE